MHFNARISLFVTLNVKISLKEIQLVIRHYLHLQPLHEYDYSLPYD